jgi:hypothetical protein
MGLALAAAPAFGQALFTAPRKTAAPPPLAEPTVAALPAAAAPAAFTADARSGLRVTKGTGVLPNEHGQVWREYDISPYTARIKDNDRPQQTIIDWILRETGTDAWFAEPLGILSASSTTLRVYHTQKMQDTVHGIVERFVHDSGPSHSVGLRVVTVSSPNWRARAVTLMKPIDVKSPGVEGWLLSRENAAMLYQELKGRSDFREHSAPRTEIANAQSQTLARTQPRRYSRGVTPRADGLGYELIPAQIDEGYSLTISPLLSLDGESVDVAIQCQVDQVEKLVPIAIDVPVVGQGARVQIQVPQLVSWRLSERLRWPTDQVLLLSCGVVANPAADAGGALAAVNPFGASKSRADALLMIEHRPKPTELESIPGAKP